MGVTVGFMVGWTVGGILIGERVEGVFVKGAQLSGAAVRGLEDWNGVEEGDWVTKVTFCCVTKMR